MTFEWRDSSKELPEIGADVLCYFGEHIGMCVGLYCGGDLWQDANGNMGEFDMDPTHWMPVPQPPNTK